MLSVSRPSLDKPGRADLLWVLAMPDLSPDDEQEIGLDTP